jgi:hypothetical protein
MDSEKRAHLTHVFHSGLRERILNASRLLAVKERDQPKKELIATEANCFALINALGSSLLH